MSKTTVVYQQQQYTVSKPSARRTTAQSTAESVKYPYQNQRQKPSNSSVVYGNIHQLRDTKEARLRRPENPSVVDNRTGEEMYKTKAVGRKSVVGQDQDGSKVSASNASRKNPVVETILLSDEDELDIRGKQSPKASSSATSAAVTGLKTPPTMDLESYYREQGTTLSHVLRLNKNYIRDDGRSKGAGGRVFWDSYSPPPGYTLADVPVVDSQGHSQSLEEVSVSPAILNAAKYKMKTKTKPIIKLLDTSDSDVESLFLNFNKRKAVDKENSPQNPRKKLTPEEEVAPQIEPLNSSFPEDDLNDSALMLISQAVENEYARNNQGGTHRNRSNERIGPLDCSTPLVNAAIVANCGPETPKGVRVGFTGYRSNGSRKPAADSSINVFENSDIGAPGPCNSTRKSLPRKSLFKPNPSTSPIKCGDFDDDDDDDLFSQLIIPEANKSDPALSQMAIVEDKTKKSCKGSSADRCRRLPEKLLDVAVKAAGSSLSQSVTPTSRLRRFVPGSGSGGRNRKK